MSSQAPLSLGDPLAAGRIVPASHDDARLAELLDAHFDGRPGVLAEYPVLVGGENRSRCLVVEESGRYVAHAAWRPLRLVANGDPILCAGIGLVTTHGAYRGRGLASRLLDACISQAREAGADVALLFSAPRSLYLRAGFAPAGREVTAWVVPGSGAAAGELARASAPRVRRAAGGDLARILALYAEHALRVERSAAELAALLAIPATRAWIAERDGEVRAYCVIGKGRDLGGVVHEWAGAPAELAGLLAHLAAIRGAPLPILSPATCVPGVAERRVAGQLALMRILAPARLGTDDAARAFGLAERSGARDIYVWGLDSV